MRQYSFLILFFYSLFSYTQNIDSLKAILKTKVHDTTRLRALCVLAEKAPNGEWENYNKELKKGAEEKLQSTPEGELKEKYLKLYSYALNNEGYIYQTEGEYEKAKKSYFEAFEIFKKGGSKSNIATGYNNIGSIYQDQNQSDKAIENYLRALKLYEELGQREQAAHTLNNIAIIHFKRGAYEKAINYFFQNVKVLEFLRDDNGLATSYNNIGQIYSKQGDTLKAISFFNKSWAIREKLGDKEGASKVLNNLGSIYSQKGNIPKALEYFNRSLKFKEEIKDVRGISFTLGNLSMVYLYQKDYEKALDYSLRALEIQKKINSKEGMIGSLRNIGSIHFQQKNYAKAEDFTSQALKLAQEIGYPEDTKAASDLLYTVYKKQGRFENALKMHELFLTMKDSLSNERNRKSFLKNQLSYEYEKKALSDSLKVVEEKKVEAVKLKHEQTQKYALYIGLTLVLIFAGFIFNRFKITQKQKHIIEKQKHIVEEKNKEITDSINYAQRIQKTLLASETILNTNLKEYFVFFKPKDIVSGDFYWATKTIAGSKITENQKELFYLAIADSTGHGVPGAFMSLLNITFLNEAINEKGIRHTSSVLNHTRQRLIHSLAVEGSTEGGNDGMDCSLLCFDFQNLKLEYSCANNPILIIRENTIIECPVDKMPVGKSPKSNESFTKHIFQLQKDDIVYAFTDGFPDQFGGEKGKKFRYKQLCELLLKNSVGNISAQKELLNETFNNWKGKLEQIDDVLVFGIRV